MFLPKWDAPGGNRLIAQLGFQLSPHTLLFSEQFDIGGANSVRGYRNALRSGDNGWRMSLEGQVPLIQGKNARSVLEVKPFVDLGGVWNNPGHPSGPVYQGLLAGLGVGLLWQPTENIGLSIDYGFPLVSVWDRSSGFQDSGFYFSLTSSY